MSVPSRPKRTKTHGGASDSEPSLFLQQVARSNADWIDYAVQVIERLARQYPEFTADLLWENVSYQPEENRAAGPAFVRARKLGYIERIDRFVDSSRASCHHKPVRVWRSCLYVEPTGIAGGQE